MKNVLLVPVGMTPQVVTETVYWYGVVSSETVFFDEIRLLTTSQGKEQILLHLCGKDNYLARLSKEYDLPHIAISEEHIHVFGCSRSLEDIRTSNDNDLMADEMTALVRDLTADLNSRIFFSIAGGRKTMGTYLALLAHFFGREDVDDRLSHVLVSPEFERPLFDEQEQLFFYPPKCPRKYSLKGRREFVYDSFACRIDLIEIPIVYLNRFISKSKLNRFNEVVEDLRRSMGREQDHPPVRIDVEKGELIIADKIIKLSPRQFALYAAMLWIKKQRCQSFSLCKTCKLCFQTPFEWFSDKNFLLVFLEIYEKKNEQSAEKYLASFECPDINKEMVAKDLVWERSQINDKLQTLAVPGVVNLSIDKIREYGNTVYGICLNPAVVGFNWPGKMPAGIEFLRQQISPTTILSNKIDWLEGKEA